MIKMRSIHAKKFDERAKDWIDDREFNRIFLRTVQEHFNTLLMARGYVFLRDVYERLGIPVTKESIVVGWYYDRNDPAAHNFIDFGLKDIEEGSRFTLDFNIDGDISHHF